MLETYDVPHVVLWVRVHPEIPFSYNLELWVVIMSRSERVAVSKGHRDMEALRCGRRDVAERAH